MKRPAVLAAAVLAAALLAAGCQGSEDDALSVVVTLPDQPLPGAAKATLLVDYSGTGARLLSEGGGPACAFILPGIDGDFADDGQGTLTIRASGTRATRGPADIAACRMKSGDENASAADLAAKLSVRVQAAEDAAGKPIDLTAPARPAGGSGGSAAMSERQIEAAQEEAVKAAASVAAAQPPSPRGEPTDGPTDGLAGSRATGASQAAAGATGAAAAAKTAATAKPAAPGNIARAPAPSALPSGSGQAPQDDSAMPSGEDRDPGYDDSPSDDETAPAYSIDFFVQSPGRFGALQLDITHLGTSGGFIGRNDKVDCVSLVEAIVASNYLGERITKVGLISLTGIRTPAAVMRCGFRTRENVSPASFLVEVTDASDTDSEQIEPPPTVVISTVSPRR